MHQGIGVRLGLAGTALVASVGLFAAPTLAGPKHSHKAPKLTAATATVDVPAAAPGESVGVGSEQVDSRSGPRGRGP